MVEVIKVNTKHFDVLHFVEYTILFVFVCLVMESQIIGVNWIIFRKYVYIRRKFDTKTMYGSSPTSDFWI